jgi:hypothetical protein
MSTVRKVARNTSSGRFISARDARRCPQYTVVETISYQFPRRVGRRRSARHLTGLRHEHAEHRLQRPVHRAQLARLQLLRAEDEARAHARHLPAPQDRAGLLLHVNHVRLPALLPGRDDHLSLQLPRRQARSVCRSGCSTRSKRPASASPHEGAAPRTRSFGSLSLRCETFRLHAAALAARGSARISASPSLASTKSSTASARNGPDATSLGGVASHASL